MAGSFTSTLFLVGPTQLALVSNQLNKFSYNSFASTLPVCGIIPVFNGFLQMNYYEPSRGWQFDYGANWLQFKHVTDWVCRQSDWISCRRHGRVVMHVCGHLKNNFLIITLKKAKMAEYLEETLEQLIGNAKLSNDFFSTKYKVRYSASPTLVPGQVIQMRLPVYDDRCMTIGCSI